MLQQGIPISGTRSKPCSNDRNVRARICFWFGGRGRKKRLGLSDRMCPRRPYSNSMRNTEEESVDDVIRLKGAKRSRANVLKRGIQFLIFLNIINYSCATKTTDGRIKVGEEKFVLLCRTAPTETSPMADVLSTARTPDPSMGRYPRNRERIVLDQA
jgi:hypothetical protein